MKTIVVMVLAASVTTPAFALVQGMNTEPVKASWSGKVRPDSGVGQGLTCNFDVPVYAEFFTGTATGQQYQVKIIVPGSDPEVVVAEGDTFEPRSHVWVKCTLDVEFPDSIIKGRRYQVRWTLSGGPDSLVYYYDADNPYKYGELVIGGTGQAV